MLCEVITMEDIITKDCEIKFDSIDSYTGEGTDHLTLDIENKITKEDITIWLEEDEVKELIKQLQSWVDG